MKIRRRLRGYAYQTFYRLPGRVRRRIVSVIAPSYTVGAVTVLRDSEAADPGRLLLLRQPPGRGWGLPAGLLKRHEPPAVGAARELFEESGVRLRPHDLTPGTPNAIVHPLGWVDMVFTGAVPASSTPLEVDGGEVLEAGWFPLDDLPPLTSASELLLGIYGIGPRAGDSDPTYRFPSGDLSGPPAGGHLSGPPVSRDLSGPPATGDLSGPPASRDLSGPPASRNLSGPPASRNLSGLPATGEWP